MRHIFPEHAGQFSKRISDKVLKIENSVPNDKRAGECVKLGDRRVLLKMPGNRLKSASSSHQAHQVKDLNGSDNKVQETVENGRVKDEEEGSEEGPKRPQPDGVNLQWGQKKRTRNNKFDTKASVEESSGAKNSISRPGRRVVRAEKVSPSQVKAPAVAPCSQLPLKSINGSSRRDIRDAEGNGATTTAKNLDANGVLESEANAARNADLSSQPPLANPDKTSSVHAHTAALPTVSTRPDANSHLEKIAPSGKVDMELFQWPKFIISLTRKEKEDDFFAIKGCKLPIRPKKRLKHVERTLQVMSPGSWLCDLTRERYEVREKKCIKKRPRGLKAMGSVDSDSD
ncbi:uncharacterized protein [Physcomitrium patens]|uniref:Uncharacterized protein n=2 Tax=Physcomitrium patens TaxID=3218 RepID=A9TSP0_PHYPA|nr:uncharacterized protein LOC112283115 isoform X1 [Physcomitrium patens]|eukprot:XP_024377219.1 uncharacterized protein LOC112283115 isoform X1 [Physcomitrella patens]